MPTMSWCKSKDMDCLFYELQDIVHTLTSKLGILEKFEYSTSTGAADSIDLVILYKFFKKIILNNELLKK